MEKNSFVTSNFLSNLSFQGQIEKEHLSGGNHDSYTFWDR